VTTESTISETLRKLISNRIIAVPVVEPTTHKVIFAISVMHLLNRFLGLFSESEMSGETLQQLVDKRCEIANEQIGDWIARERQDLHELDPVITLPHMSDLFAAIRELLEKRAHRVIITDEQGKLVNIITQSTVCRFVDVIFDLLPRAEQSVEQLGCYSKQVFTINEHEKAINAFKLMKEKKVSGIGVVDDLGTLIGVISADDLKLIGYDLALFSHLLKVTVKEYLEEVSESASIRSHVFQVMQNLTNRPAIVKCSLSSRFGYLLKMVNFYRVHRIFVVDPDDKAVAVVSLTDILNVLMEDLQPKVNAKQVPTVTSAQVQTQVQTQAQSK